MSCLLLKEVDRKHVLEDLQPYVCTFEDCKESDKAFDTQRAFIQHEIKEHRSTKSWECPSSTCFRRFPDKESLLDHVVSKHWSRLDGVARAKHAFEREDDPAVEDVLCPFCQEIIKPGGRRVIARHLGQHMERISFAVVTRPYASWKFYDDTPSERSREHGNQSPKEPNETLGFRVGALNPELAATLDRIYAVDLNDPGSLVTLTEEHALMKAQFSRIDIDDPDGLEKMEACHTILQIIVQKFKERLELLDKHEGSRSILVERDFSNETLDTILSAVGEAIFDHF